MAPISYTKPVPFEGSRQLVLSDPDTQIPVTLHALRSSILVSYDKNAWVLAQPQNTIAETEVMRKPRHYPIFYVDVARVVSIPAGLIIETTVSIF